ncbi:MAG: phosphopyruvate hydratase [Candidatus Dojkabacteria bacterium]
MKIKSISAYEILASGGYPTVEVGVELKDGSTGIASVPYGASAGSHEAAVLVDQDEERYGGKGVLEVIDKLNDEVAAELVGKDAAGQRELDELMISLDGTENKSRLGGNGILAVSLAIAKAEASSQGKDLYEHIIDTFDTQAELAQLPNPMVVVIEGGKHADNTTDLQEYCISGISDAGPSENIRKSLETYHELKKVLREEGLSTNVGNEGAFAPNGIETNESPFDYILAAANRAGYEMGEDLGISIDAAASEFYKDGKYELAIENRSLNAKELIAYYETWFEKYPIISLEDGLNEDDWENWVELNKVCEKHNIEHIGDDLTVTNQKRLQKAINMGAITSILIKLNQIGTLTETVDTCLLAKKHGLTNVPSHRGGGETNDTAMVDLAVAVNGRFIKVGPTRGERVAKYNRLMEIERQLS